MTCGHLRPIFRANNEVGAFTLPNLPVGPYRLEAALAGFQTFVQTGITIQVNSNLVVDPALRVGTVVEQERILELPLNARQVTDLITLSGAAVQVPNSVIGNMVTGVNISVAGGGRWGVQYLG